MSRSNLPFSCAIGAAAAWEFCKAAVGPPPIRPGGAKGGDAAMEVSPAGSGWEQTSPGASSPPVMRPGAMGEAKPVSPSAPPWSAKPRTSEPPPPAPPPAAKPPTLGPPPTPPAAPGAAGMAGTIGGALTSGARSAAGAMGSGMSSIAGALGRAAAGVGGAAATPPVRGAAKGYGNNTVYTGDSKGYAAAPGVGGADVGSASPPPASPAAAPAPGPYPSGRERGWVRKMFGRPRITPPAGGAPPALASAPEAAAPPAGPMPAARPAMPAARPAMPAGGGLGGEAAMRAEARRRSGVPQLRR